MRVRLLGLALVVLAACSTKKSYVYQPAVQANAQASGYPAAYFPIPVENPLGDVRIASFGVTEFQPTEGGPKSPALQIRMIIANNRDEVEWSLDTRQVLVALGGAEKRPPAVVNADGGEPPLLRVARGQKATVDLWYALPPDMDRADRLPAFDLLWEVRTGTGPVAQRTPFEREQIQPSYAWEYPYPYGYPYYFGPYGPYAGYYGPYGLSFGFGVGWVPGVYGYPYHRSYGPPTVVVPQQPHGMVQPRPPPNYWGAPRPPPSVGGSGNKK